MTETGWDPEVKKYFRKIINSFALGFLWIFTSMTAGLYFKLAFIGAGMRWHNAVFYALLLLSFAGLLRFYYNTWKG